MIKLYETLQASKLTDIFYNRFFLFNYFIVSIQQCFNEYNMLLLCPRDYGFVPLARSTYWICHKYLKRGHSLKTIQANSSVTYLVASDYIFYYRWHSRKCYIQLDRSSHTYPWRFQVAVIHRSSQLLMYFSNSFTHLI